MKRGGRVERLITLVLLLIQLRTVERGCVRDAKKKDKKTEEDETRVNYFKEKNEGEDSYERGLRGVVRIRPTKKNTLLKTSTVLYSNISLHYIVR